MKAHPDKINSQYGPAVRPSEYLCRVTTVSGIILPSYRAYPLSAPAETRGQTAYPTTRTLHRLPFLLGLLSDGFEPHSPGWAATDHLQPCLGDPLGNAVCVKQVKP